MVVDSILAPAVLGEVMSGVKDDIYSLDLECPVSHLGSKSFSYSD